MIRNTRLKVHSLKKKQHAKEFSGQMEIMNEWMNEWTLFKGLSI